MSAETPRPTTYAERRQAGEFERAAAERAAELAAAAEPAPEAAADARTHVPLGADVELYTQIADWAPEIAGFRRFDLAYDTPGANGQPGIELAQLLRADVVLDSWVFVLDPYDGSSPTGYLKLDDGSGNDYYQSFTVDQVTSWQGYGVASEGEGLFGVTTPLVFWAPTSVRFYIGDNQGGDSGSTQGRLVLVIRVLPAPPTYPG